jgi:DNA-binding response OmpR family regulator
VPPIMEKATLLIIEGKHAEYPQFAAALSRKGFVVEHVSNGSEAIKNLNDGKEVEVAIVNAATLRTSGKRICQSLHEACNNLPIVLILDPDHEVEKSDAEIVLTLPFTAQKLANRVRHLIPGESKHSIHAGPIHLDLEKRTVRAHGKRTRLTPNLLNLLNLLMEHRGEVMERKALFSTVWETNYTDDTRTLDVHISWLRRAIEQDPKKPVHLKTIRGVGYQLEI